MCRFASIFTNSSHIQLHPYARDPDLHWSGAATAVLVLAVIGILLSVFRAETNPPFVKLEAEKNPLSEQMVAERTGSKIPLVGLGTGMFWKNQDCAKYGKRALDMGYRLVDTAEIYKNEEGVGKGLGGRGVLSW